MYCFEYNGKQGFVDVKCFYFKFDEGNNISEKAIGHCMRGLYMGGDGKIVSFEVPKTDKDLIDGKYIKREDCPLLNETKKRQEV